MKGEGGLELGNSAEMISAELAVGNSAELEISESAEDDVGMWESKVLTSLFGCEVCGTRASVSSLSNFEDLKEIDVNNEGLNSGVGSVFLPLRRCNKRKVRDPVVVDEDFAEFGGFRGIKASDKAEAMLGEI
nr:hypothetical protein CFP56_71503 [Quercus suber]